MTTKTMYLASMRNPAGEEIEAISVVHVGAVFVNYRAKSGSVVSIRRRGGPFGDVFETWSDAHEHLMTKAAKEIGRVELMLMNRQDILNRIAQLRPPGGDS